MYAIAIGVALVVVVPIVYAVLGGFRTTGQIAARPVDLPSPWVFENYAEIITDGTFWRQVLNSVVIASITMLVVVPCASLAAFVLARFSFKGREAVYVFFTLGLLFPVAVAILPLFISLRTFGLINSWFGVALPQAAFALPTTIIVLRPFFRSIPAELEEAAAIDGCGPFRFFWKIVLPLSRPVLATVSVLAVVASWNAFLLPLLVLNDPDLWTLPLGVQQLTRRSTRPTPPACSPSRRCRWCRRWCSTSSPNARSSAGWRRARSRADGGVAHCRRSSASRRPRPGCSSMPTARSSRPRGGSPSTDSSVRPTRSLRSRKQSRSAGAVADPTAPILAPIGAQEVWAAGVTYERSREARVEESSDAGGGSFYDRVYDAERPELFLKATPHRVAGPGGAVRIRGDSQWNVPEPELTLAVSSGGPDLRLHDRQRHVEPRHRG